MKRKVDTKFTLQGILISSLLAVIATFLGFIFLFVFKLYDNSVGLTANVAALTVKVDNQATIQTAILDRQVIQYDEIKELQTVTKNNTKNIDTIRISYADLKNGFFNHEGRLVKLEKYHE